MISDIDPGYKKNVLTNQKTRKRNLYGKLAMVVYSTLFGAILLYKKISKQFIDWWFEPNNYNMSTFNKVVDGEQFTM